MKIKINKQKTNKDKRKQKSTKKKTMELNVPLVNRNRCAVGPRDLYNTALAHPGSIPHW